MVDKVWRIRGREEDTTFKAPLTRQEKRRIKRKQKGKRKLGF